MTTSAGEENYSLRWNNHQSHILESFDALLQQNSLVDVTLVCADRSLRAHKVVLSACSPFFEKVFNDTPCKHPTIVLKDFKGWLMQAIVDFMYRGEISVQQERLNQLIEAAESLQIRGLVTAVPIAVASENCLEQQLERENCNSPMPRRKQARPRRRSGDLADLQPQDLSNGTVLKCETEIDSEDEDEGDEELHELAKHVRQNGSNNVEEEDEEEEEEEPTDGEEKENQPESELHAAVTDVPQNLCTKRSTPDDDEVGNDKNNNNDGNGSKKSRPHALPPHDFHERFILSLKDLRHLNRYRQGPPGHPFNDLLSHLPISPPPSFQMPSHDSQNQRERETKENSMKIESDNSDAETPPYPDHLDHLPPHHSNFPSQTLNNDKRENHHKMPPHMMGPGGMPGPFPPPPFQQQSGSDGGPMSRHHHSQHQPHSPLPFPPMPSVSALTLTPPHMFGLDSPLGLFPPGMDPSKMYNPLMDLPDHHGHRGIHPDAPPFLKKKLQRPKGQHSAPRGGPPRSWTNAELTEALQHVWNKKMTTSQASRIFGIPYNSLLMYVRGKYGKSLKLEQLRKDCISGPPIEMLQMNPTPSGGDKKKEKSGSGNHDENHDQESPRKSQEHHGPRRSASSDADMMNPLFNPFPGGFYPDFPGAGFPGLQLSMLNLLPPDARLPQPMMPMVIDDDCKSDTGSVQSLEDSLPPTPLNLNREKNGNGHESSPIGRQMFPN